MFNAYHAIMFAILLITGATTIFQTFEGDDSLTSNPKQASHPKVDLNKLLDNQQRVLYVQ